ncbi:MAG: protein kinase, partial [Candidatus Eremiobacteraeota bacterium]|nr:protein kinase [Candidatus Eremiobacteraeota bacterium]
MHSSAPGSLTPRQAEIAAMVARGESNREIANALELSTRTVETHIVSIFNKLGVRSRVELAVALLANPASDPLDSVLNNLPRRPSMFIGREREIGEIRALVESQQLVPLVGSAGVGKTTTSLRVAETMLDEFPDGVWFVELASLPRGDYVPAAVARVLDLTLSVDEPMRSLAKRLASRRTLLLFDNCEHLVEPVAAAIATILRACSNVKILASSRHRLEIAGEATYRVPSLSVPGQVAGAKPGAAEVLRYEAATLFVERATAADNRFTLTNDNAFSIADICRRLDGIPLAIELAAARTNILSPQQLCAQLGERFRLLTGGSRDAMARHQTLRSLIDWSYDLLDERERVFFRRFGIFVNGFTLDGASAVAGSALDEEAVFAVITSLVDKSLLLAEPVGDAMRYRMLESTSAYARER